VKSTALVTAPQAGGPGPFHGTGGPRGDSPCPEKEMVQAERSQEPTRPSTDMDDLKHSSGSWRADLQTREPVRRDTGLPWSPRHRLPPKETPPHDRSRVLGSLPPGRRRFPNPRRPGPKGAASMRFGSPWRRPESGTPPVVLPSPLQVRNARRE